MGLHFWMHAVDQCGGRPCCSDTRCLHGCSRFSMVSQMAAFIPALLAKHASAPESSITSKVLGQAKQALFCDFPAVHRPDAAKHWHAQEKAQELSTPSLGRLVRDPALLDEGVMLVDSGDAHWPIVYANTAAAKLAGGAC